MSILRESIKLTVIKYSHQLFSLFIFSSLFSLFAWKICLCCTLLQNKRMSKSVESNPSKRRLVFLQVITLISQFALKCRVRLKSNVCESGCHIQVQRILVKIKNPIFGRKLNTFYQPKWTYSFSRTDFTLQLPLYYNGRFPFKHKQTLVKEIRRD